MLFFHRLTNHHHNEGQVLARTLVHRGDKAYGSSRWLSTFWDLRTKLRMPYKPSQVKIIQECRR
jgi:hypothetical protein